MKNRKGINLFFALLAIMFAWALYKQFEFQNLKFEKPPLAFLYFLMFVLSIYFLIRDYKKQAEE